MDRDTGFPPARTPGPVPVAVVDDLLAGLGAAAETLVDREVAAREIGRFKLDVSYALSPRGAVTRFSVNDKGEHAGFRARLRAALPSLGAPAPLLERFLSLSPPGAVQTTVAVKPESPARIGLYFEELGPGGMPLVEATLALAGARPLPVPDRSIPGAVCIDIADGEIVGAKDYHMVQDRPGEPGPPLPLGLDVWRDRLPWHLVNGGRHYLVVRRYRGLEAVGAKLMWMSECWIPETAAYAWSFVADLRAELGYDGGALDALRARWRHDAFLHPDLVSINVDAAGRPEALVVYVSAR